MLPSVDALPGITWTRERLLDAAGFEAVEDVRRAVTRDREALDAILPEKRIHKLDKNGQPYVEWHEGGAPDYDTRLRASEHVYDLADVRKRRDDDRTDPNRPVAVNIILTDAQPSIQANGVEVHLSGDGA